MEVAQEFISKKYHLGALKEVQKNLTMLTKHKFIKRNRKIIRVLSDRRSNSSL